MMAVLVFVMIASLINTVSASLMCPESVPTVSFVPRCPSNAMEWKSASDRKKCNDVGQIQKCTKAENFVYHCVFNEEATMLLEVCAPPYFMSGYCARYSRVEQRIINDPGLDCTKFDPPCPPRFQSNESYKYQLCYTSKSNQNTLQQESDKSTTATGDMVLSVIFGVITLFLLILLFVGYKLHWIELSCRNAELNGKKEDEEDQTKNTGLLKDSFTSCKPARDETTEAVVSETINTEAIKGGHCEDKASNDAVEPDAVVPEIIKSVDIKEDHCEEPIESDQEISNLPNVQNEECMYAQEGGNPFTKDSSVKFPTSGKEIKFPFNCSTYSGDKKTDNREKTIILCDPSMYIQGDNEGKINDEDLRSGNYEGKRPRPTKQKELKIQESLPGIEFERSDSKRKIPADTFAEMIELNREKGGFEFFKGRDSAFSMWYPCKFIADGKTYNSVEQYMVHQKAVIMNDTEKADIIMVLNDPREIREIGKQVNNFDPKIWDECCEDIVETGNIYKFSQNRELKEKLCRTYPKPLVEANPYNTKWAIGLSKGDPNALNELKWMGRNLLGKILTKVRDKLRHRDNLWS